MSLAAYRKKRNFNSTPEPSGGKGSGAALRFVVQKHDASHLHYDFRLEMDGVLKSWAIPKGPSADPSVKRLAMMVEDHPFDYRNFEGIIPKGQYGGGTVIVWDEGFYSAMGEYKNLEEMERDLLKQLKQGKLVFTLQGQKLKGEYALVKSAYRGEQSWLLMKAKDRFARTTDITRKDKSVISGKNLAQMEKNPDNIYGSAKTSGKLNKTSVKTTVKKKAVKKSKKREKTPAVPGVKSKFPATLAPMLATLVDKPFDADGWIYEIKWDGYRAIGLINGKKVSLMSRNNKSFNDKFYPVTQALSELGLKAVVDGEIVVVGDDGIADFGSLQNWRSEADGELYYYIFDLLWLNGRELTGEPLTTRQALLEGLLPKGGILRMSTQFTGSGIGFFQAAQKMGLEGIVAKKADSVYQPGKRSSDWLKIKANKRQEMVIGGFTRNDDSSKLFSSLLVGVFDKNKLVYTGKVGTGFNQKMQKELMAKFAPLVRKTSPFNISPDINKPSRFRPDPPHATATWLSPKLVCEVSYAEMTSDAVMRHPSFEGMREDKKATAVVLEKAKPVAIPAAGKTKASQKSIVPAAAKKERKTLLNPTEKTQVKQVCGHELTFTNLDKLYWPDDKITKRDLINYYYQVAPFILPYLKNRPQSMNRHPDGINGKSFYFKDVTGKAPAWVKTFVYHSEADDRDRNYLVAENEASLLYMASLGCIEMNPWHSTVNKQDYPDWCVIDLDPGSTTFEQVIEAALVTRSLLDRMGITGFPKTSGSKGIHIYIPLGAKYSYEQSKEFARAIATMVHQEIPAFTSIERAVKDRKGKMYIDFLQNRPQATISAPYSLRPKPGATVSMPLHWEEVKSGLRLTDFTIHNALERVKSVGDLFKPVLGKGIDMKKAIGKLEEE